MSTRLSLLILAAALCGVWGCDGQQPAQATKPPPKGEPIVPERPDGPGETKEPTKNEPVRVVGDPRPLEPWMVDELALVHMVVIQSQVRAFRFKAATDDLETLRQRTKTPAVLDRIAARVRQVGEYLALLEKLMESINSGPLKNQPVVFEGQQHVQIKLMNATRVGCTVQMKRRAGAPCCATHKGSKWIAPRIVVQSWESLTVFDRWMLIDKLKLSTDERFTLVDLSEDLAAPDLAERVLGQLWDRQPKLRDRVGERLARLRGVPVPEGGYRRHHGAFVTPDEEAKLNKGLVFFRGQWVTPEDKEQLAANLEREGDVWMPLSDDELSKRGYTKHLDGWLSPDELAKLRSGWNHAWTNYGPSWTVKTNRSEQFCTRLSAALENLWPILEKKFGDPSGESGPLKVFAFGTENDFQAYCRWSGMKRKSYLFSSGFSRLEANVAGAYDRRGDPDAFLGELLRQGAKLFFEATLGLDAEPPAWLTEGIGCYYEGVRIDPKGELTFHHRPAHRLVELKLAIERDDLVPLHLFVDVDLRDLQGGDIYAPLRFSAQAWGLYYFLMHSPNPKYRDALQAYVTGRHPDLIEAAGADPKQLERDFVAFIRATENPTKRWVSKGD